MPSTASMTSTTLDRSVAGFFAAGLASRQVAERGAVNGCQASLSLRRAVGQAPKPKHACVAKKRCSGLASGIGPSWAARPRFSSINRHRLRAAVRHGPQSAHCLFVNADFTRTRCPARLARLNNRRQPFRDRSHATSHPPPRAAEHPRLRQRDALHWRVPSGG